MYTILASSDDTLDLLNQANRSRDRAERQTALQEMGRLAIDEYAMALPIYYTTSLTAVQPYVHDIGIDQFGYTYEIAWLSN